MQEIKQQYTIVIVTHNMQQAARVSDRTAFFTTEVNPESDRRTGCLVEFDRTDEDLLEPGRRADRAVRHGEVRLMDELRQDVPHRPRRRPRTNWCGSRRLVTESIPRATAVLLDGDLEGADYIIRGDDEIDARSIDIEEHCYRILALQAPVASDLRQVIALLKMVAEVERCADLLCNICKAARRIYGHELDPKLRGIIGRMGEQAQQLYDAAIESFVENDAAKAAAIDDMDSYLDGLQKQFVQAIFESHAAGRIDLQVAVQLAVVARFYERIGDHAVNIGEKVRFVVTGWMPEQKGAERYRKHVEATGEIPRVATVPGDDSDDVDLIAAPVGLLPPTPSRTGRPSAARTLTRSSDRPRRARAGRGSSSIGRARRSTTCRSVSCWPTRTAAWSLRNAAIASRHGPRRGAGAGGGRTHVHVGARAAASRIRRSSCSARRARSIQVHRDPAGRRRRGRRPSRTSASAPGSTPCAPTSSPTSATS